MDGQSNTEMPRTVLVVEDEEPVRTLLQRMLQRAGFTVLACASSEEALELSASLGAPIHALVTDVVMRGVHGRELARRLQESRPELRVLFVSGYSREQVDMKDPRLPYLEKPFPPDELVRRVTELLSDQPAASRRSPEVPSK